MSQELGYEVLHGSCETAHETKFRRSAAQRWLVGGMLALIGALVLPQFAAARTWFVDPAGVSASACVAANGTSANPFNTIQKAAACATPTNRFVEIRTGTYREQVVPANSGTLANPIVFRPAPGATVTISGADPVTGWTQCNATTCPTILASIRTNVYYATMSWNVYEEGLNPGSDPQTFTPTPSINVPANQVFVGTEMMPEARWPNLVPTGSHFDFSRPVRAKVDTAGSSCSEIVVHCIGTQSYTDGADAGGFQGLGAYDQAAGHTAANYWQDAYIHLLPSKGGGSPILWFTQGEKVTTSSYNAGTTSLTATFTAEGGEDFPRADVAGARFFLTNKITELSHPGEWFKDIAANRLYLYQVGGGVPTNVTARSANAYGRFAFDLSARSYVTIQGKNGAGQITLFSTAIKTSGRVPTTNCASFPGTQPGWTGQFPFPRDFDFTTPPTHHMVVDGIIAKYLDHFAGIFFNGHWNPNQYEYQVRNTGIVLAGYDNVVKNSTLQYSAGAGIDVFGCRNTVTNNTIKDIGYSAADGGGGVNVVFADDTAYPTPDLNAHVITYNTIQDVSSGALLDALRAGKFANNDVSSTNLQNGDGGGVYYGQRNGNGTEIAFNRVHDTFPDTGINGGLYSNSGPCPDTVNGHVIHHNLVWNVPLAFGMSLQIVDEQVYNNTFIGTTSWAHINSCGEGPDMVFQNNVFRNQCCGGLPIHNPPSVVFTNNYVNADPGFVNETGVPSYDFQLTSAAAGRDYGTENSFSGCYDAAPDVGAFEFGQSPWIAGSNLASTTTPSVFLLLSPNYNQTGLSTMPTLDWSESRNATTYVVEIDDSSGFGSINVTSPALTTSKWTVTTPLSLGTPYYWRVKAKNGVPTTTSSPASCSFTVGAGTPPGSFGLLAPADGAAGQPTAPVLDWQDSTGATSYVVYVDNDSDFSSIERTSPSVTASTWTVTPPLLNNTTYYWRVVATNGSGSTPNTAPNFSLMTAASGCGGAGPLLNGGFECGTLSPGWLNYNETVPVSVVSGAGVPRTGIYAVKVPAPAVPNSTGLSQTLSVSNGTHTFGCYLKNNTAGGKIEVGVDGYGDSYVLDSSTATSYELNTVTVNVTTGTITVWIFRADDGTYGTGDSFADDCTLT